MDGVGRCTICQKRDPVADAAAAWVTAFYPDVTVVLDGQTARLASTRRDEAALRMVWLTSLANERLLLRGGARRSAVLEALVR